MSRYQQILQQEVTRKQFIQVMVLAIVSLFGFNNLLTMLSKLSKDPTQVEAHRASGFGANKFGV